MNPIHRAHALLAISLLACAVAGAKFVRQWTPEPLFPSAALTRQGMLSDYKPELKGAAGDTEIYYFEGEKPGGTVLICGGTHPNEPAAYVAAVAILENLRVSAGRVIVIPRANKAGFMHTDSQEAMVHSYRIETPHGMRVFRNGSRFTAPVKQWPDPTIYVNPRGEFWDGLCVDCGPNNPGPGNQTLAGSDSRNLNRVYPGKADGTMTEQVGYAIMTLIRKEGVGLAIDFHEASPEYPTINVMVAHQRAADVASWATLSLSEDGVEIGLDASAIMLRGLSHREWGDGSPAMPVLFESANVAQGRLKGRVNEEQITKGIDLTYHRAELIQKKLNERLANDAAKAIAAGREPGERSRKILYVSIPEGGIPIELRAGRHVQGAKRLIEAFSEMEPDRAVELGGLPSYKALVADGLGQYLHGPGGQPPATIVED